MRPIFLLSLCFGLGCASIGHSPSLSASPAQPPQAAAPPPEVKLLPRVRPADTIRLGGVYTLGLGTEKTLFRDAAAHGVRLSAENAKWISDHCDLIALDPIALAPGTFRKMTQAQPLFTPLLFLYASYLSERARYRGSVGGWNRKMAALVLRNKAGTEIAYLGRGAHWMDFTSKGWADHWKNRVLELVAQYGAQGVVTAELPIDNPTLLRQQHNDTASQDRIAATTSWLTAVRAANRFLMIPSGLAFDLPAGQATLPMPEGTEEPELTGRLWDQCFPLIDGAWVEGWVRPYWADAPLAETVWERQLEAADRAGKLGQVFIAAAAYRNDAELDYALASYLLVVHQQGRMVFQPMPLHKGERPDAGYSLKALQREIAARPGYFNVRMGVPEQDRHLTSVQGGNVWRRAFQFGVVYVNSTDLKTMQVELGSAMKRLNGASVRRVTLPPHSGVTLLYQ